MLRTSVCLAAMLLVTGTLHTVSAQTTAPAAKPSKMKLTADRLKDMKAKWSANKGKLAVCRKVEGTGRRRPLVLHRRLHGQDLRAAAANQVVDRGA
jgi:hypothetical protein